MYDDNFEEIEIKDIGFLYELRHAVNIYGIQEVATGLKMDCKNISKLYGSDIHGSIYIAEILSNPLKFKELFLKCKEESEEREERIASALYKNECLIEVLKEKRKDFAKIGTNKAKRRLNKMAITDPVARAVRIALEIEDTNIKAKDSYGKYRDKIYKQKTKLILELCELFKAQNWIFGVQESDLPYISHIIYFEIPGCEQISWHFTIEKGKEFPVYKGEWDKKENSTLGKLEFVAGKLLELKALDWA